MGNEKAGFRLLPQAWDRLRDEMRHYRGRQAPLGEFVSRLIMECPDELWLKVRDSMDVRYEDWHQES
jgi:hypothetical protein